MTEIYEDKETQTVIHKDNERQRCKQKYMKTVRETEAQTL